VPQTSHEKFIKECYKLARRSVKRGKHPFSAILLVNNEVFATADNTFTTNLDCTAHAEMNLIRKVQHQISSEDLAQCILYSSTEPCAMCAGAIYWAGIRNVVFGCSAAALKKLAGQPLDIPCRDIFRTAHDKVSVVGPVLEEEGLKIHQAFWKRPIHIESKIKNAAVLVANEN